MMKREPAWVGVAKELCDLLQENQDEMDFLQEIDRKMVRFGEVSLEDFISSTVGGLTRFSQATHGHLYVDGGDQLFLMVSTDSQDSIPNSLPLSDFSQVLPAGQDQARLYSSEDLKGQLEILSSSLATTRPIIYTKKRELTLAYGFQGFLSRNSD